MTSKEQIVSLEQRWVFLNLPQTHPHPHMLHPPFCSSPISSSWRPKRWWWWGVEGRMPFSPCWKLYLLCFTYSLEIELVIRKEHHGGGEPFDAGPRPPPAVHTPLPGVGMAMSLSSHIMCHSSMAPLLHPRASIGYVHDCRLSSAFTDCISRDSLLYIWPGNLTLWAHLWSFLFLHFVQWQEEQPASFITSVVLPKMFASIICTVIQPALILSGWWGGCDAGALSIAPVTGRLWAISVSLLLKLESLVFLHLVRLESQFHKPHTQFRKLILVHFSVCLEGHHCWAIKKKSYHGF